MPSDLVPVQTLPAWVPDAVRLYLSHTESGLSLRQIARAEGVHASTVLRQVRRFEARRDDPLVDCALNRLRPLKPQTKPASQGERPPNRTEHATPMEYPVMPQAPTPQDPEIQQRDTDALLRALARAGTVLVVAPDMARAVVLRDAPQGSERVMVIDRELAESLALRGWIHCVKTGRVSQYALAPAGRAALRERQDSEDVNPDETRSLHIETPISILARRRDRDGQAFLTPQMRQAADQLHHDFTLAQMSGRIDWAKVIQGQTPVRLRKGAPQRVAAALGHLGPGLGDMALRVCCQQEGLEAAERALGWSARSGKIVLRIALDRLARYYADQGEAVRMIG